MRVSVKIASTVVLQRKKILASAEVDNGTSFSKNLLFFFGADNTEFIPLNSISEHTDSGRTSPQGIS